MAENSASLAPSPAEPVASPKEGLLGLVGVYYDPAGTARRVQMRWFWIYPLIVVSVVLALVQLQMVPYIIPALKAQFVEQGMSGEQLSRTLSIAGTWTTISAYLMPLLMAFFAAIGALLMLGVGAAVDVRVRFRTLFTLSLAVSMISMLQQLANFLVIRTKGPDDIQTMADVVQPFGLDIFVNLHGVAGAALGFFSIFMIWQIVMTVLIYADVAKVSKGKAFLITAPGWVLGLLVTMLTRRT